MDNETELREIRKIKQQARDFLITFLTLFFVLILTLISLYLIRTKHVYLGILGTFLLLSIYCFAPIIIPLLFYLKMSKNEKRLLRNS